ncbi:Neuronatin [Pteropus alecto]|uniref:Neuronatin n=1 Tax=Pteropus alecto TaxID=9402 RepID=L5JYL7_PTEAL|nr:Neuronatin [Pteropus alecto]
MRSAPGYPSLWTPPCAHAQLGGGWLLKARPRRLQQCAQQRTPRDQRPSANLRSSAALALNHPPNALGTMAAVAAASAELLIIGWYIFRVLLQVGEGSRCEPPGPASPRRNCRLRDPSYPDCRDPCARVPRLAPRAPTLRPPPSADPSRCARARPGTKSWGAAGASRRRTPRLLATNVVFRYSLQKLAYTVSRTGRQVLGERRRAPN